MHFPVNIYTFFLQDINYQQATYLNDKHIASPMDISSREDHSISLPYSL